MKHNAVLFVAGGGLRIREDVLERDYCLACFLNAMAESDLRRVLAFKGGTALKRCYFPDYRLARRCKQILGPVAQRHGLALDPMANQSPTFTLRSFDFSRQNSIMLTTALLILTYRMAELS